MQAEQCASDASYSIEPSPMPYCSYELFLQQEHCCLDTLAGRYLSQGLLANPMLTSLDHAGRGSWLTHLLSSITYPIYQLTAGSIVTGFMLMDWPVRVSTYEQADTT